MNIYLLRHGESIGNTMRGYIAGRSDSHGLTARGRSQILKSAAILKERSVVVDEIFTSPVVRAMESAEIMGRAFGRCVHTLDFLTELSYGSYEGKYWWDVHPIFDEFNQSYPGGESLAQVADRVYAGLEKFIPTLTPGKSYLLVTHMVIIPIVICYFDNRPARDAQEYLSRFVMSNGSIWHVGVGRVPQVQSFPFLPEYVSLYIRGVLGEKDTVEIVRKPTVGNTVFHARGNKDYLVKIYQQRDVGLASQLAALYRYIEQSDIVGAPRIEYFDDTCEFFNRVTVIQDYVQGVPQDQALDAGFTLEILKQIYAAITRIHSLPLQEVREFWVPNDFSVHGNHEWHRFMSRNIRETGKQLTRRKKEYCKRLGKILDDLFVKVVRETRPLVPLHGDVASDNLLLRKTDNGGYVLYRLLDFEWARIGDALWDYAYYTGWLDRLKPSAVDYWLMLLRADLDGEEYALLQQYRVLFHAWSVRDGYDYPHDTTRVGRARLSDEWLREYFGA
jgi:broad specificity phosphatase PhoE/aminoglycoside phosphotransferase (APT) family kinase protein